MSFGKAKFSIGQTFQHAGLTHEIIWIDNPRSYTFIYTCKDSDGRTYKLEEWQIQRFIK